MKPPAFQFYADDFVAGVADLSTEDVGAYILLLCFQWGRGSIPETKAAVERVARCEVSPAVMAKFPAGKNPRLEAERKKQADYRALQSAKGHASAQARFNRGSTAVQPRPVDVRLQPEGNSPSPSPSPSIDAQIKKGPHPKLEDVQAFGQMRGLKAADIEHFWHHFESAGWIDKNGNQIVNWQSKLMTWKTGLQAATANDSKIKRQPFISELKAVLEAKKAQRQAIHNRGHEDALGWRAKNQDDAAEHRKLNKEISELMNQMANSKP